MTNFTLIEYMPEYLRASHEAAGNAGIYPHNGAVRAWVTGSPDEVAALLDTDWAEVVRSQQTRPGEVLDGIPLEALGTQDDED